MSVTDASSTCLKLGKFSKDDKLDEIQLIENKRDNDFKIRDKRKKTTRAEKKNTYLKSEIYKK